MLRGRATFHLFALLGLALAAGGCKESDSILLIEVAGPTDLDAVQLQVVMSAGLDSVRFGVPATPLPSGETISLPASFTVALDRSLTGPIMIEVDAVDATMSPLAAGTTTMQHIEIGGQTVIPVFLMEVLPPGSVDGGVDAATDAADSGGGGAGGSAGAGGSGGTDGAAGADGGIDVDDAGLGLDGDTD